MRKHRAFTLTRRSALAFSAGALAACAVPARVWATAPARGGDGRSGTDGYGRDDGALRFLRVRHRTVVVEIGGARVLVDPCFAPGLGAGVLFRADDPLTSAAAVGDIDVLLVGAADPGALDRSTRSLRRRDSWCLVGDERAAKQLRHHGFRRVRVAVPGDDVEVAGVRVRPSPSRALLGGPAVGFHLEAGGRSFWHAGAPPPLDVDGAVAAFARDHAADVLAVCALGLVAAGSGVTLDVDDAALLAALCRARYLVPLHDDVALAAPASLLLRAGGGGTPAGRAPSNARTVVGSRGAWVRVAS